ncbi:MAG: hypothetical protein ACI9F9_003311, partial [Candidatus Paceibacteria bacterium]
MKRTLFSIRPAGGWHPLAFGLCVLSVACAPADSLEITQERSIRDMHTHLEPGASGQMRFGGNLAPPSDSRIEPPTESPFIFTLPKGWEELAPTSMRIINLRPAGNPAAECALTVLGGSGGGMLGNIDRWRKQIGLPPTTQEEVDKLPRGLLLGADATIVDLKGAYTGMGDDAQLDWGLCGYILITPRFTAFIKMTGPAAVVDAERLNFELFCASLDAKAMPEDPHAPQTQRAPVVDQTPPQDEFRYALPGGWREGGAKSMRSINLLAGAASECYAIVLGGDGGGLLMNLNRWRGEVGLDPFDEAEMSDLPTVKLLGVQCPLLEVTGDYQGMGGPKGDSKRVLGVPLIRSQGSVFIKMVGP